MKKEGLILIFTLVIFAIVFVYSPWKNNGQTIKLVKYTKPAKLPKRDRVDQAFKQEFEKTMDPALGYVPRERLETAREIQKQKFNSINNEKGSGNLKGISGITWTERGPNNVGGRTRALMFDPGDVNNEKVWAGGVSGGLWYNNDITDVNSTWNKVDDFWDNLAVTVIVSDPNDDQVFYVGTGEGHFSSSVRGAGLFKTTDGGSTWTHMTAANGFYATDDFHFVNDIVVRDESGSSVVYVAAQHSFAANGRSGVNGLYRSTDGGVNFSQVLPNMPAENYPYIPADIEVSASNRLFVGTTVGVGFDNGDPNDNPEYSLGGDILYSDDGTTWTLALSTGDARVELACAPSDSDIIYAVADDGSYSSTDCAWIKKCSNASTDADSWSDLTVPKYKEQGTCTGATQDFTRAQAWYDLIMAVHPTDPDIAIVGGIDLYRTTNGSSFSTISYWTGTCDDYVHADQHAIVFRPGNSNEVVVGNDGGVFYSADAGDNTSNPDFTAHNSGYNVTQFYGTAIHPTSGTNHFLAGAQDNGSHKFTSSGVNSTTEVSGGDGAFCHIDQDDPSYQFTQYVYNVYYRSTNGGASFTNVVNDQSTGQFINPTDYDNDAFILYGGSSAGNYFRWNDPRTGTSTSTVSISGALGTDEVTAVTVDPNTSNRVYFGSDGAKVIVVDNANGTPSATDISDGSFSGYVSHIEVEDGDANHLLVTFSNYGVTSVWESTDAGANWTAIEGDLPDMPVRWGIFHPLNSDMAILATELGVWTTDDINGASTEWESTNSGLSNVRVDMLQVRASDNEVIAATHGRGLFSSSSFAVTPSVDPVIYFSSATNAITETSETAAEIGDCRPYKDYTVSMSIGSAPTGDATVTLALSVNTDATEWEDFVFTTNGDFTSGGKSNTLTFADGATTVQNFTVRIYDDASIESTETIEFEFSVSGTTDAYKHSSNTEHTITLNDNDTDPSFAGSITLLSEDFEGGALPTGWTISEAITSTNDWRVDNNIILNGSYSAYVSRSAAQNTYSATDDAQAFLITEQIDATSYSNMNLSFNYQCNGEYSSSTYWDYGLIAYSLDGSNFTPFGSYFQGVTTTTAYSVDLPAEVEGQTFYIAFYWENDDNTGSNPAFVVDDIVLTAGGTTVASTVNYSTEQYLGPNETVLFYDDATNELIAKIENTSSHDYGCTTVTIDRAGTGTTEFWSATSSEYLMDKTVLVTPTNNNTSGTYNITLYYTSTEVTNWMTATSKVLGDLTLAKVSTNISNINSSSSGSYWPELGTSNTASTFGDSYYVTASFTTGFSGFGAGDPGPPPAALPLELLSFDASVAKKDVELNWVSATEENTDYIEIEHSRDGKSFEKIGQVSAAGNSDVSISYDFVHHDVGYGVHYYRLNTVDRNGTAEFSKVVSAFQNEANFDIEQVYPVPANHEFTIRFNCDNIENTNVRLINNSGYVVYSKEQATYKGANTNVIDCGQLRQGFYILEIENQSRILRERILIAK